MRSWESFRDVKAEFCPWLLALRILGGSLVNGLSKQEARPFAECAIESLFLLDQWRASAVGGCVWKLS
jgi:hypothetical protein